MAKYGINDVLNDLAQRRKECDESDSDSSEPNFDDSDKDEDYQDQISGHSSSSSDQDEVINMPGSIQCNDNMDVELASGSDSTNRKRNRKPQPGQWKKTQKKMQEIVALNYWIAQET